ncbi:bifunctional precorrin-2 dehydrogenase/sirohydrochlorin ferrochelatase [Macrococcus brunensis]|uniref:precorrin-2 dehydrogenase n=1 Tax=Macrococcus brunensis TaxID=198483 RepID=A0A4R6BFH2_9STAP|nr:bifunctional precorrin-2 dehydrogenase/sirohydrochlorin ferrochelatase [Macrococcus brunensis]TDL98549.1 bifunctional precorrin-2 dehydrogenase/sirohydrochlorin ferrochelatase [Macrococcus brunensis]ULG71286.1 bifunctional precorrin-2 dehydrogenase/sirohydrochlorin ferrochelatase [Macrococcus brunensis]ULG73592.1 bifunctional precorrin-2 dehydrogenase/sirohydrochlorin ferrochelatase [Macrococcus brunensis]
MYPVMLDLTDKKIVIVGGGRIAARKVNGLKETGASITVIAPEILETINGETITCIKEPFHHDLSHFDMIFIATDDAEVNARVMKQIKPHQLVNDCTNKKNSNFFNMASFRTDDARIMISTDGKSPETSKKLKERLKLFFNS